MRHHPTWNLEIGYFYSWTLYYMEFFPKIWRKPFTLNGEQADSFLMQPPNNYTEDPMIESCFRVYPTKKHKPHCKKHMRACVVVLINLAPRIGIGCEWWATIGQKWWQMPRLMQKDVIHARFILIISINHQNACILWLQHGHLKHEVLMLSDPLPLPHQMVIRSFLQLLITFPSGQRQ